MGIMLGIFFGVIVLGAFILYLRGYLKRAVAKREAERVARLRRAVNPEEARKAEEYVRNAWAQDDRRRRDREEAFELQTVTVRSYGTNDTVVEPEPAYRHPRMDWK
jgi:hypothetical protein